MFGYRILHKLQEEALLSPKVRNILTTNAIRPKPGQQYWEGYCVSKDGAPYVRDMPMGRDYPSMNYGVELMERYEDGILSARCPVEEMKPEWLEVNLDKHTGSHRSPVIFRGPASALSFEEVSPSDLDVCSECWSHYDNCSCNDCPDCGYYYEDCICNECPDCGRDRDRCVCNNEED